MRDYMERWSARRDAKRQCETKSRTEACIITKDFLEWSVAVSYGILGCEIKIAVTICNECTKHQSGRCSGTKGIGKWLPY
jgi:hypothetical protein